MRYIFVDYTAYLSGLLKLKKNIGKTIEEIDQEYNLKSRLYTITKNCTYLRQKNNMPLGAYFIDSLSEEDYNKLYTQNCNFPFIVGIRVTDEELKALSISDIFIYEMEEIENGYYLRTIHDRYVLRYLTDVEIASLNPKVKEAYLKHISNQKYYFDFLPNGNVSLELLHSDVIEGNTYYIIDESYEEELDDLVLFLKSNKTGTFHVEDKETNKKKIPNVLKHLIRNKGEQK